MQPLTDKLDILVAVLQAGAQEPELAEPDIVHAMLADAGSEAASIPGVGSLLRGWTAAIESRGLAQSFASTELEGMADWFAQLQRYAAGALPLSEQAALVQFPAQCPWLPLPTPAFADALLKRLQNAAPKPFVALEVQPESDVQADVAMQTPAAMSETSNATATACESAEQNVFADAVFVSSPDTDVFANDASKQAFEEEALASTTSTDNTFVDREIPTHSNHGETAFADSAFADAAAESTDAHDTDEAAFTDVAFGDLLSEGEPRFEQENDSQVIGYATREAVPPTATGNEAYATPANPAEANTNHSDEAFADDFAFGMQEPATALEQNLSEDAIAQPQHRKENADLLVEAPTAFANALPAQEATPAPASQTDAPLLWISQEERDLTLQAINEQLLPLAIAWSAAESEDEREPLMEDIQYQCDLLVNVLELVGTQHLADGTRLAQQKLSEQPPGLTPDQFMAWCAGLIGALEMPGVESADMLDHIAAELTDLDAAWRTGMREELARMRSGADPTLKAIRKSVADPADVLLQPADDVLPNVLEGMLRELPVNAARLGSAIRAVVERGEFEQLDEARRAAHTLKGDANTVGIRGLASLSHALEDSLTILVKRGDELPPKIGELLIHATDLLEEASEHVLGRGPEPRGLLGLYQQLIDLANALEDGEEEGFASVTPATHTAASLPAATSTAAPQTTAQTHAATARTLTVDSHILDNIQDLVGESRIASRRIDLLLERLGTAYKQQQAALQYSQNLLSKLDDLVALRGAALQSTAMHDDAAIDPLEIDQYNELHVVNRQLAEATADNADALRQLQRDFSLLSELRSEQEHVGDDLQRTVLRTRMAPFGQLSSRLQRIVRQTGKQVMKPVELEILGENTLIDAELLERIVEPLGHLIRNAIDHGIEDTQLRYGLGKPETASLRIQATLQGDTALIDVIDDGRGLDLEAIRRRALMQELIQPEQVIADTALARLILLPGFSTREETTEISGRGVGMDVVNQRIAALRGSLQLINQPGRGLHVQLRLPVSQTLANVVVVRGERHSTAVIAAAIGSIVGIAPGQLRFDNEAGTLTVAVDGVDYPALPMEALYRESTDLRMWQDKGGMGLLVRQMDGTAQVVLVRSVQEVRSVLVKPISPDLPPIPAVRGIAQLADGGLAPVVDLDILLGADHDESLAAQRLRVSEHKPLPRVLIADDSLSVRRSLEQLMVDAGFEAVVAADGVEALAQIEARPVSIILLDMEMPRMNGLEVARSLRNHPKTHDLPVVMITSRSADKHRQMALDAGVTEVLTKPVTDDTLVALVHTLLAAEPA